MIQGPCLLGDSTPDGRWLSAVKNQYMVAGGGGLSVGLVLGQRPKKPPRGVLESPLGKGHAAIALSTLNTHRPHLPSPRPSHQDKVSRRSRVQVWVSQGGSEPWEEGRTSVPSGADPSRAMASAPGAIPAPGSSLSFLMQSLVSVHPRTDWAPGLGTDPQQQHVAWGPGEHEESAVNTGHCVLPPGGRRFIKTAVICRVSVR